MVYTGWLELDGVEIINNQRAVTHAANLGIPLTDCADCPNLSVAAGNIGGYHLPDTAGNEAPWWDAAAPESARFAGVVGLEIGGLDKGVGSRSIEPTMPAGGVFGPFFERHRQIPVRVLLAADGDDALAYGFAWFASAVRGEIPPGCTGGTACVFAVCPTGDGSEQLRQLFGVDLIEPPEVTQRSRTSACGGTAVYMEVEFTLASALPWIYYAPITIASVVPGTPMTVAESVDPCTVPNQGFPTNSFCPPPLVDVPPLVEANPCWPLTDWPAWRSIVTIPGGLWPGWFDAVPVVTITGNWGPRMSLRWFTNPLEEACSTIAVDDRCPCHAMNIAHNGFESIITLDGRNQSATVFESSFAGTNELPFLYDHRGSPYAWPVFECATPLCVEIVTSTVTLGTPARFDIAMAARVDGL